MKDFKPGTLHDGICFDYALPISGGDGEYRIPPRATPNVEPDIVIEDEAPSATPVDMVVAFGPNFTRLRRRV
jgi:hypothetical protein